MFPGLISHDAGCLRNEQPGELVQRQHRSGRKLSVNRFPRNSSASEPPDAYSIRSRSTIGGLNEFKQPVRYWDESGWPQLELLLESSHLFRVIEVDQEFDGNDTTQLEITGSIDASRTTSPQRFRSSYPGITVFVSRTCVTRFGHLSGY